MFSLVFLICTQLGCTPVAPDMLFATKEQCQAVAEQTIKENQKDASMPKHKAIYVCVSWGESV